jgi:DNA-binding CsgD family transcriptional regulator
VLSQYVEERYASDLIIAQGGSAGSAGPLGYLLKDRVADVSEFIESVERIASGSTVLDPEVVAQLLTRRGQDDRMRSLTERERTVLALIAEGRSNQAIAATLFLSEASVEKHITAIFQKLGLEPDESGNRRVLAAIAHISSAADGAGADPTDRNEPMTNLTPPSAPEHDPVGGRTPHTADPLASSPRPRHPRAEGRSPRSRSPRRSSAVRRWSRSAAARPSRPSPRSPRATDRRHAAPGRHDRHHRSQGRSRARIRHDPLRRRE